MNKLTGIRKVGRFINPETGNPVNVHKGRVVNRSTEVLFWLSRGQRNFISDRDFCNSWIRVE